MGLEVQPWFDVLAAMPGVCNREVGVGDSRTLGLVQ